MNHLPMILALDTALRKTGYAVGASVTDIRECGILWADKHLEFPEDRRSEEHTSELQSH